MNDTLFDQIINTSPIMPSAHEIFQLQILGVQPFIYISNTEPNTDLPKMSSWNFHLSRIYTTCKNPVSKFLEIQNQ